MGKEGKSLKHPYEEFAAHTTGDAGKTEHRRINAKKGKGPTVGDEHGPRGVPSFSGSPPGSTQFLGVRMERV